MKKTLLFFKKILKFEFLPIFFIFLNIFSLLLFGVGDFKKDLSGILIGFLSSDITFAAIYYGVFANFVTKKTGKNKNEVDTRKIYSLESLLLILSLMINHLISFFVLTTTNASSFSVLISIATTVSSYCYFALFIYKQFRFISKYYIYNSLTKWFIKERNKIILKRKISKRKISKIAKKLDQIVTNSISENDENTTKKLWVGLISYILGGFKPVIERYEIGGRRPDKNLILKTFAKKSPFDFERKSTEWIFDYFINKTTEVLKETSEDDFENIVGFLSLNKSLMTYDISVYNLKLSLNLMMERKGDTTSVMLYQSQLMQFLELINFYSTMKSDTMKISNILKHSHKYNQATFDLYNKIKHDCKILKMKIKEMSGSFETSLIRQANFNISKYIKENFENLKEMKKYYSNPKPILLLGWESIETLLTKNLNIIEKNKKISKENSTFYIKELIDVYKNSKNIIFENLSFENFELKGLESDQILVYIYETRFHNHDYKYAFPMIMAMINFAIKSNTEMAKDEILYNTYNGFKSMRHLTGPLRDLIISAMGARSLTENQLKEINLKIKTIIKFNKNVFFSYEESEYLKESATKYNLYKEAGGSLPRKYIKIKIREGITKEDINEFKKTS